MPTEGGAQAIIKEFQNNPGGDYFWCEEHKKFTPMSCASKECRLRRGAVEPIDEGGA